MSLYEKATPRPWRIDPNYPGDVQNADGSLDLATAEWTECTWAPGYAVPGGEDEAAANAALIVHAVNNIEAQEAEILRLRGVLLAIEDGTYPRPIGTRYRRDGEPSKYDSCIHNVGMGLVCETCLDAFVSAALSPVLIEDGE